MPSRSVSILGCGWLGLPLAKRLLTCGFSIKGSTTTPTKIPILKQCGIEPFLIRCGQDSIEGELSAFLQSKYLFLNIPFSRSERDPNNYYRQVKEILAVVADSPVRFVVFASSTSVYPKTIGDAKEDAQFVPDNDRAKVLLETEKLVAEHAGFISTIVRFAGLYGGTRQFAEVAASSGLIRGHEESILNLIYLDDCIELLTRIIVNEVGGEVLNACCDGHPTRREFYNYLALKNKLPAPSFKNDEEKVMKIVNNSKIKKMLDFEFQYPTPLSF